MGNHFRQIMKSIAVIIILAVSLAYTCLAQPSQCDYKIETIFNVQELEAQDFKLKIQATKLEGFATNITGTIEIKDQDGKIVRIYKPWTSEPLSKQKTSINYFPNLKSGEYTITSNINVGCDDINKNNNIDVKTVKIKSLDNETIKNSNIRNSENIIYAKDSIKNPKIVYASGNEKSKSFIMVFLLILSVLLNVVLIWKR